MDLLASLLKPIPLTAIAAQAPPTSIMELLAVVFTVLSVFGATRLKIAQYPVGIIATVLYSFVFFDAKLYSSLALNIYFTVIQLYGWYFWMYGGRRAVDDLHLSNGLKLRPPKIGNWPWKTVGLWAVVAAIISFIVGELVAKYLHGSSALLDAGILSASVLAQFLLDRKQLKSWYIWVVVNVLSIIVYGFQQHLLISGILYTALLLNAFYGLAHWKAAKKAEDAPKGIEVWEKGTRF